MKLTIVLILLTCAVGSQDKTNTRSTLESNQEWNFIASISGSDTIAQTHVNNFLNSKGIDCIIEGSTMYGVSVQKKDVEKALEVLQDDLKKQRYNITLHADGKDIEFKVDKDAWKKAQPLREHKELIKENNHSAETALGRALRSEEILKHVTTFGFVREIKSLERKYMDKNHELQTGYDLEIELAVSKAEAIGSVRIYIQSVDNGNKIYFHGSTESWQGNSETVRANQMKYDRRIQAKEKN